MNDAPSGREPLEQLAENFLARYRAGERPSITEYTGRHPDLAEAIRELFPALLVMEANQPWNGNTGNLFLKGLEVGQMPEHLGEYRLLREVGRGGMGVVYEAVQESLGRHVALKVLPFNSLINPTHLERFRREARAAARLHHTHIVPIYGVGEHEGYHFYAMQFIQGHALDAVLREVKRLRGLATTSEAADALVESIAESLVSGRWPNGKCEVGSKSQIHSKSQILDPRFGMEEKAASPHSGYRPSDFRSGVSALSSNAKTDLTTQAETEYFRSVAELGVQTAEALEYAHRQGILHRDIKPSNLLLDTAGQVWVADFGLAKAENTEELTHQGDLVGTLRYLAPERLRGQADARSDVYGLGITLYEMLTLRAAFKDSDRALLVERVRREEPLRPRRHEPRIPADLETIVLKSIAKAPSERYPTALAMAEDLRRFLSDRPIQARRASAVERCMRWLRRNPVATALILSLVLLALVVGIGALWLKQQRDVARVAEQSLEVEHGQALHNLDLAIRAERQRTAELCQSYLAQVRAGRLMKQQGQSTRGLAAIRRVIDLLGPEKLSPSQMDDLRNEAIACLVTPDLEEIAHQDSGVERDLGGNNFDPRLEYYTYVDQNGDLVIRRLKDNQVERRLSPPPEVGPFWYAFSSFSPDGRFLQISYLVEYERGIEVVWDLPAGQVVLQAPLLGGCDFRPDSRALAVATPDKDVCIYQLPEGKLLRRLPGKLYNGRVRFDPTGRRLACGNWEGFALQILDIESGKTLASFAHPGQLEWMDWSSDGRWLAVPCRDHRVYVYDMRHHRLQSLLEGHDDGAISVRFSPEGNLLASWSWDRTTCLWDPVSGKQWLRLLGKAARFSADGRSLAFEREFTFGIWRVHDGSVCHLLHYGTIGNRSPLDQINRRGPWIVAFVPLPLRAESEMGRGTPPARQTEDEGEKAFLISAGSDGIRTWDIGTGRELCLHPAQSAESVAWNPHTRSILTYGPAGLFSWPVRDQPEARLQKEEEREPAPIGSTSVEKSARARVSVGPPKLLLQPGNEVSHRVACAATNHTVAITDGSHRQVLVLRPDQSKDVVKLSDPNRTQAVRSVAVSPDGRWVAAATRKDVEVKVWKAATSELEKILSGGRPEDHPLSAVFSADGQWLIVESVDAYRWWRVGSWEASRTMLRLELGGDVPAACSPDGQLQAVCLTPRTVQLIDSASGREMASLAPSEPHSIKWLAFSPDSTLLAAATQDNVIQLWDLRTLRRQLADMNLDWPLPSYAALEGRRSLLGSPRIRVLGGEPSEQSN